MIFRLICICTYLVGCCCPEDSLQLAYENAQEAAWTGANIINQKFSQPAKKVENPTIGQTYILGNTNPPKYNGAFVQLTNKGWVMVSCSNPLFFKTDDLQKSKNSKAAFVNYIARQQKYIRFTPEEDGVMNLETFQI